MEVGREKGIYDKPEEIHLNKVFIGNGFGTGVVEIGGVFECVMWEQLSFCSLLRFMNANCKILSMVLNHNVLNEIVKITMKDLCSIKALVV